jgi:hypothetical protein
MCRLQLPSIVLNSSHNPAILIRHIFSRWIEQKDDEQHHILCIAK